MDSVDARLEGLLREPETEIGNDGFSAAVMTAVRATRRTDEKAGRWTLGVAVVAGALVAALIDAPLASAFSALAPGSDDAAAALAVLFVALAAVPTAWGFYAD